MINAIIFDFNGPVIKGKLNSILEKHSLARNLEKDALKILVKEYFKGAHVGEFKDMGEFFEKTNPSLPITSKEMDEIVDEASKSYEINKDMIKLILKLKNNYKIALLTNYTSDLECHTKEKFGIHDHFDIVINSYDVKMKKPDPKIFHHTLKKLNIKAEEAIFIDDREEHVESARNLGIKSILYEDFDQFKNEFDNLIK